MVLGCAIAALVALCVAFAWQPQSMVAAQPAAASTGNVHWLRLFAVAQSLAFGLFAVALLIIRQRPIRTIQVVSLAAIIQLLPLAAPLMLSTDAYSYWNAGRLATVDHGNPYVDVPADYPSDPSFAFSPPEWRDQTTGYGPAFTLISAGVAVIARDDPTLAAWLFKGLAGCLMVALTVVVSRIARRAAFAAAFVGWNPIFAIQFAGAGHNDVLMVTLVLVALWYAGRGGARPAGVLWALSVFVKWFTLILVPLQVLEDRARQHPSSLPGLTIGVVVLAGVSSLVFGLAWLLAFQPIADHAAAGELNSLAIWPRLGSQLPDLVVKLGPLVGFGIAYVFLLREAWRGRARRGLAMGLLLVASPFLWTWYVVTPAAVAAAEDDVAALWIAFGLCAYTGLYLGVGGNLVRVLFG